MQQAAQDAQAAAEAEASLAAQISSAVETAQQSQSQSDAVSQSINKLVTVSSQSADAPKKTLEKLQAIQAVQNQMAYEVLRLFLSVLNLSYSALPLCRRIKMPFNVDKSSKPLLRI